MAILKALPGSAKINGKPVKGKLIQVKKSVINIDKFLEKKKEQTKKQIEITEKQNQNFKRRKKEEKLETPKNEWKKLIPKKIPGLSFLDSIKKFIGGWIFGFVAIKLIPLLPSLIPVVVNLGKMVNFIINIGGAFLNGFISFINFGVRAQEATFGFLKDFGGEKFADAFAKFGGLLQGVLDGMLILGALTLSDALSGDSGFGLGDLLGKKGLGKFFGKKAAATGIKSAATATAGTTAKTAAGLGAGATAAVVAGAGLLASGLGEGAAQLNKWGLEREKNWKKKAKDKWWTDPRKYFWAAAAGIMTILNRFFGVIGGLLDIIGAPFRMIIELIRFPFLDEAGKKKQAENLAKFDARIREQFRQGLNAIDFLGLISDDKGSWGSLYGEKGTDGMGYTKDGKTKSQQKTTAIAPTPKTTETSKTTTPKTPKSRKPQGLMRGIAGAADYMTLGMFDFDKRNRRGAPKGFGIKRIAGGLADFATMGLTDFDKRGKGNFQFDPISGGKDKAWGKEYKTPQRILDFRKNALMMRNMGQFGTKDGRTISMLDMLMSGDRNQIEEALYMQRSRKRGAGEGYSDWVGNPEYEAETLKYLKPQFGKQAMKFDEELLGVSASYETNGGQKEYTIYAPTTQINMLPGNDSGQLVTSGSTASSGDDPYEILEKG